MFINFELIVSSPRLRLSQLVVELRDVGEYGEPVRYRAVGHVLRVEQGRDAKVSLRRSEGEGAVAAKKREENVTIDWNSSDFYCLNFANWNYRAAGI